MKFIGLSNRIEESLYSAMEDFRVETKLGNKQIIPIYLEPFCLIGATTCPGKIAAPLRERFDVNYNMEFYADEELAIIIVANAKKLGLQIVEDEAVLNLARRSRGTPRIANRLLRRVRDYAQVVNGNCVDSTIVNEALDIEGVDPNGLTKIDKKYLHTLFAIFGGGPSGFQAIAASMQEDPINITEYVEPYLLRKGFIGRTKSGRLLTARGMEYTIKNLKKH